MNAPASVALTDITFADLPLMVPSKAVAEVAFIYREIFEQACYLRNGVRLGPGAVVIDVGANLGLFSLYVARHFDATRVFAFEPVEPIYLCAKKNLASYDNVQVLHCGLSDAEREIEIEYFPKAPSNSTVYSADKHAECRGFADGFRMSEIWNVSKPFYVLLSLAFPIRRALIRWYFANKFANGAVYRSRMTTLDRVLAEQQLETVDLLKIDVEGAELDVLAGLSDDNLTKVRQLALEISPKNKSRLAALKARLSAAGFRSVTVESVVASSDPDKDVYPCVLYAVR